MHYVNFRIGKQSDFPISYFGFNRKIPILSRFRNCAFFLKAESSYTIEKYRTNITTPM